MFIGLNYVRTQAILQNIWNKLLGVADTSASHLYP